MTAMYFYSSYIRTPSYNWLVFVCLMVSMTALLRESRNIYAKFNRKSWANLTVFASASWVSSFGKPSTGPFLLLLSVLVVVMTRERQDWKGSVLQIILSFLPILIVHHFFVLSLGESLKLIQRGMSTLRIQDPEYYSVSSAVANVIRTTKQIPKEIVTQ